MPNWCDCTYKCVGDLKDVRSLYKALKYIDKRKTSIIKNGFGKWWLGNLVVKLGGNWEKYRCRGEITYYELNGNILTICQNTNDANGEYFPERYYLDSYVDDSEYFTTIEEAADHVSGIIGEKVEPDKNAIEEALDEYMEELDDEDVRYSFHEFTVVDE